MQERRFRSNTFERLEQGSRARNEQAEAFRLTQISGVTSEVIHKNHREKTVVPAAAVLSLVLLAACARADAGSGQSPGDVNCDGQSNSIEDRKSTRLNSSHSQISYAVF